MLWECHFLSTVGLSFPFHASPFISVTSISRGMWKYCARYEVSIVVTSSTSITVFFSYLSQLFRFESFHSNNGHTLLLQWLLIYFYTMKDVRDYNLLCCHHSFIGYTLHHDRQLTLTKPCVTHENLSFTVWTSHHVTLYQKSNNIHGLRQACLAVLQSNLKGRVLFHHDRQLFSHRRSRRLWETLIHSSNSHHVTIYVYKNQITAMGRQLGLPYSNPTWRESTQY